MCVEQQLREDVPQARRLLAKDGVLLCSPVHHE